MSVLRFPVVCVFLILAAASVTAMGPLNPPAGPIISTSGPEPRIAINAANTPGDVSNVFKITQPGSYYLTGNVAGVAGRYGIGISASGVTVDLNGFDVVGVPGSLSAIMATAPSLKNITVRNGSVRNSGSSGVDLSSTGPSNCVVANVTASDNAGNGISIWQAGRVVDCITAGNGGTGIITDIACNVTGCTSFSNALMGIAASTGSTIANSVSYANTTNGINAGNGCTITGCTADANTGNGINAGSGCTFNGCSTAYNGSEGIRSASGGCTVRNCTALSNTNNGILMAAGSTVTGNTCSSNGLDGINISSRSIVSGNTCASNGTAAAGGAGVHVTGSRNRVEDNHCSLADSGIVVDGTTNLVARNTCSGNTVNWTIAIGNSVAPIVLAGTNGAAIGGNTFAGSLGSTDPNANFTY